MDARLRSHVDLLVRIQHHPSRASLLPPLVAALAPLPVEVVADPGGPKPLAWRTYRACLERPVESDWLLVLQDDAVPCPGFATAVTAALAHADGDPVALFVPNTAMATRVCFWEAQIRGDAWCWWDWGTSNEWVSTVALAWPRDAVAAFLAWCDARGFGPETAKADDHLVGRWARSTGQCVLATVPSLVEHPDELPSLVKNDVRRVKRRALAFASDGADGIDWSRKPPY